MPDNFTWQGLIDNFDEILDGLKEFRVIDVTLNPEQKLGIFIAFAEAFGAKTKIDTNNDP